MDAKTGIRNHVLAELNSLARIGNGKMGPPSFTDRDLPALAAKANYQGKKCGD